MAEINFHRHYFPLVANPFARDNTHLTLQPSPPLQPFVRCFWGSAGRFNPHCAPLYGRTLVIPDTCFDLILMQNYRTGEYKSLFIALSDTPFTDRWAAHQTDISLFAVRFQFWAMGRFTRLPLAGTLNGVIPPEVLFPNIDQFCARLFEEPTFPAKAALTEQYLLKILQPADMPASFLQGVDFVLSKRGVATLGQLSKHLCYSERQVQRIFLQATGATPKHLMNLVRYQSVWRALLTAPATHTADIVHRYGYADQSHFVANFKKYHSLTPQAALHSALG